MNERTIRAAAILPAAALALFGCANPLASRPEDYGERIPLERTRRIEPLPIDQFVRPEEETRREEEAAAALEKPEDRFAGLPTVEVSLPEARAWTLENNLDLKVVLVNPTIAAQRVREEDARFEPVLFGGFRRTETDQPTATSLVGTQIDSTDFNAGVRIPLRTGGEVTVDVPLNSTETNNPFTFLNPSYSADATFSISQPLLRGAGREANTHFIRVAALNEGIEQARTKLEVIRQLAAADRSYWRLYAARQALDVAQQQYELALAQVERARRRVVAGQDPQIEVTRAEEGLAQRLEAIIVAQNAVLIQQRELKRILNAPGLTIGSETVVIPGTPPDPVHYALDPQPVADAAVANRMEMLEQELLLAIDQSTIDFRRNEALPLFTVDYTYNLNGLGDSYSDALSQVRRSDFSDWSLGLRGELPLGNEAANSRVDQAILARLQRLSTKEARELSIRQETLNALDALEAAWQRILAARQTAILAGRTLQGEQRQFEVGMRTSTDVLDAATRLADAQLAEIRALADYQISQVDLAFATGTLLGESRVIWSPLDPRPPQPSPAPPIGG